MAIWIAVVLGIVQGVFMFLPVSSTAHLVLTQHWLLGQGHELPAPESAEMIFFDLVVHVGTLVSIVVVFWPSLKKVVAGISQHSWQWASQKKGSYGELLYLRMALLCVLSVFFTGIIGITLKLSIEHVFANPMLVAGTLSLTGVLLWWTDGLRRRPYGLRQLNVKIAAIIGIAQGFALIPGLSRSGMTITFALFAGLKRRWAAEYSFFLAIPTILAATMVQAIDLVRLGQFGNLDWAAIGTAFVVSALVGIAALKAVLFFLYRAKLKIFSFYLWGMALLVVFGFIDAGNV